MKSRLSDYESNAICEFGLENPKASKGLLKKVTLIEETKHRTSSGLTKTVGIALLAGALTFGVIANAEEATVENDQAAEVDQADSESSSSLILPGDPEYTFQSIYASDSAMQRFQLEVPNLARIVLQNDLSFPNGDYSALEGSFGLGTRVQLCNSIEAKIFAFANYGPETTSGFRGLLTYDLSDGSSFDEFTFGVGLARFNDVDGSSRHRGYFNLNLQRGELRLVSSTIYGDMDGGMPLGFNIHASTVLGNHLFVSTGVRADGETRLYNDLSLLNEGGSAFWLSNQTNIDQRSTNTMLTLSRESLVGRGFIEYTRLMQSQGNATFPFGQNDPINGLPPFLSQRGAYNLIVGHSYDNGAHEVSLTGAINPWGDLRFALEMTGTLTVGNSSGASLNVMVASQIPGTNLLVAGQYIGSTEFGRVEGSASTSEHKYLLFGGVTF